MSFGGPCGVSSEGFLAVYLLLLVSVLEGGGGGLLAKDESRKFATYPVAR